MKHFLINLIIVCALDNPLFGQKYVSLLDSSSKQELLHLNKDFQGLFTIPLVSGREACFGFSNGKLVYEYIKKNNKLDGIFYTYNELNGNLKEWKMYQDDCLDGIACKFYLSGTLASLGNYECLNRDTTFTIIDTIPVVETGEFINVISYYNYYSIKSGIWNYFSELGTLVKQEEWINGICVNIIVF